MWQNAAVCLPTWVLCQTFVLRNICTGVHLSCSCKEDCLPARAPPQLQRNPKNLEAMVLVLFFFSFLIFLSSPGDIFFSIASRDRERGRKGERAGAAGRERERERENINWLPYMCSNQD